MPEDADDDNPPAPPPRWRRRTTLIAGAAVVAAVGAVAVIVVAALPSRAPRYASPSDPCKLVTVATLHKYLGEAPPGSQGPIWAKNPQGTPRTVDCEWFNVLTDTLLSFYASIYRHATDAQRGFQATAQASRHSTAFAGSQTKVTGTAAVTGLGDGAAAAFMTTISPSAGSLGTSHLVDLTVWSGNAEIGIQVSYGNPGSPPPLPSRSAQLATVVAAARDVLAALPRA